MVRYAQIGGAAAVGGAIIGLTGISRVACTISVHELCAEVHNFQPTLLNKCEDKVFDNFWFLLGGLAVPAVISCVGLVATVIGVGGGIAAAMASVTGTCMFEHLYKCAFCCWLRGETKLTHKSDNPCFVSAIK